MATTVITKSSMNVTPTIINRLNNGIGGSGDHVLYTCAAGNYAIIQIHYLIRVSGTWSLSIGQPGVASIVYARDFNTTPIDGSLATIDPLRQFYMAGGDSLFIVSTGASSYTSYISIMEFSNT